MRGVGTLCLHDSLPLPHLYGCCIQHHCVSTTAALVACTTLTSWTFCYLFVFYHRAFAFHALLIYSLSSFIRILIYPFIICRLLLQVELLWLPVGTLHTLHCSIASGL